MFRKTISFIFIAIFAMLGAFNCLAQIPPKIVKFKVKAEKIETPPATKAAASNFIRTDALVFYETLLPAVKTSVLVVKENISPIEAADSKIFRERFQSKRNIEFIYV
jgi:hypothetical protein